MSEANPPLFDPPAFVREIEAVANAGGWTTRYLSPADGAARPWFQRPAQAHAETRVPSVYLSAGIHGDEISGPLAILEMLRRPGFFAAFDTTLFPILNPHGLARNRRENADGIDLNRDYRNSKSEEIRSHIEALKTLGRFDASMMLHEDFEGIGAYLYELNDELPQGLGKKIIAAMGRHVPIDQRPEIEEVRATGGVIQRSDIRLKHGSFEERPDWPEAIYLCLHHTKVAYTTETPKPFPLVDRIAAQIAAVETMLEAMKNAPLSS